MTTPPPRSRRSSRGGFQFTALRDPGGEVLRLYNPAGSPPYTVLIDRAGRVAHARYGYAPADEEEMEERVKVLLSAPPAAP